MDQALSLFLSSSNRWLLRSLLFLCILFVSVGIGAWISDSQVRQVMRTELAGQVAQFTALRDQQARTLDFFDRQVVATPCSPAYYEQLRQVAFLPDGFNQFMQMSGSKILCALGTDGQEVGHDLGPPDIAIRGSGAIKSINIWSARDLSFLGLDGKLGDIVSRDGHAIVVADQTVRIVLPNWIDFEVVVRDEQGAAWHRAGTSGLWDQASGQSWFNGGTMHEQICDAEGLHCAAGVTRLTDLFGSLPGAWLSAAAMWLLIAVLATAVIVRLVDRYLSFEARFRRRFSAESVECVYQPIMRLSDGVVSGCEVLARWRDIDGSIVMPDSFLPIVEKMGRGDLLTRWVIERARHELRAHLPDAFAFRVNINIFPADLRGDKLVALLSGFSSRPGQFLPTVEILETGTFQAVTVHPELERLRASGIEVYLDDFGTGFSNIQNLASLPLDGVKLDRGFAMADDDSLLGRLLPNALDMINESGQAIVVEGLETEERLDMLKASGKVSYVQGYLISRPLPIKALVGFLRQENTTAFGPIDEMSSVREPA